MRVIQGLILKARPLGELRCKAVRGRNVRSKTLSVTLTRATSPKGGGFKLFYFTNVNSRLSYHRTYIE